MFHEAGTRRLRAEPSRHARDDERLGAEIRAIHRTSKQRYGSPRVHAELHNQGRAVGRKRVARLMRENGLSGLVARRFRRTTDSNHKHPVTPNLLGWNFSANAPDRVWVGDITYVWTLEGWAYVAVLLDLYSRRVVGWALRKSLSRELPIAALQKGLQTCKPTAELIHHSDRGSQYASREYRKILADHAVRQSMSSTGSCFDNAVAESFFASLKKELVHRVVFATRTEAYDQIAEYIDFYNSRRLHSTNGYVAPIDRERLDKPDVAA